MATYTPRPDGLVNVDIGGGRMLPMGEAQAQAGGATPAPPPSIAELYGTPRQPLPQLPPDTGLPPQFATPGVSAPAPQQMSPEAFRARLQPPGVHAPAPEAFPSSLGGGGRARAPEAGQAYAALDTPEPPHEDIPGNAAENPNGLVRIAPEQQSPEGSPQARFFGQQQGGQIVQTSKGGDIRASFVRRPGEELDPAAKAYADSLDPAALASSHETATTNAAIARDNAVASQIDATRQAEGELEAQRAQVAQNRAALQQKLDIVDRREREAADATPQTRREVLQSRGALAGVLSGISIALGGYVQGLRGGENPGLKIINDSIESEISSQRAKWEASKDKVGMARSDFGQAMQLYGDPNMAEADMRMRALTLAANMTNAYKAQGDNQEWLANQQMIGQQLAGQAAAEKQKWKTLADGQVVQENYVYHAPTFAQVGGGSRLSPKDQREEAEKARERLVRAYDGKFYYANGRAQNVPELQTKLTAAGNFVDVLDKIDSRLAKAGPTLDLDDRNTIEALRQQGLSLNSKLLGEGVVTEGDAKRNAKYLGDTNSLISDNRAALKALRGTALDIHNSVLRDNTSQDPYGYEPTLPGRASSFKAGLK